MISKAGKEVLSEISEFPGGVGEFLREMGDGGAEHITSEGNDHGGKLIRHRIIDQEEAIALDASGVKFIKQN